MTRFLRFGVSLALLVVPVVAEAFPLTCRVECGEAAEGQLLRPYYINRYSRPTTREHCLPEYCAVMMYAMSAEGTPTRTIFVSDQFPNGCVRERTEVDHALEQAKETGFCR